MIELTDLCKELHNWFEISKHFGTIKIERGRIDLEALSPDCNLKNGQLFRIVGSVFNDGVYRYPVVNLADAEFDGAIWAMAVPSTVIAQMSIINQWLEKNQKAIDSPFQSESFGGYSYTKPTGENNLSWQSRFRNELNRWRKI